MKRSCINKGIKTIHGGGRESGLLRRCNLSSDRQSFSGEAEGCGKKELQVKSKKDNARNVETLRYGWKFKLGDSPEMAEPDYDDSGWETVRVPHDWAITGPFDRENDIQILYYIQNGQKKEIVHTGNTGGLPHVGKAWYRLRFSLPGNISSKRIRVEFDGVMSHGRVYCNGKYAGCRPYGYSSFSIDITDSVRPGENLLAVSVDNKPFSSRWYPGAGIYRNVRLVTMSPLHVAHWGTYITTTSFNKDRAEVCMETSVENHADKKLTVRLETTIFDPKGKPVASAEDTKSVLGNIAFRQKLSVKSPLLWSVDSPELYIARSTVKVGDKIVDTCETSFGIRSLRFDPEKGFFLNGKNMKLNGVCMHHDLGPLGSAINTSAMKRQLAILKDMGCNSIRTSHNPPAPELLELADKMGFLVIDEAFDEWRIKKCDNGYHMLFDRWAEKDLRDMIRRDRNHPCVIMWSIGNEILEQKDAENGAKTAKFLHDICKREDPTRPTTAGFNYPEEAMKNGLAQTVDIPGWNYKPHMYARYHSQMPGKPMYGSETASCLSSRGEYYFPVDDERIFDNTSLQVSSYDLSGPGWAGSPDSEFRGVEENPFIMGEFAWTGFDYLGEPYPYQGQWPSRSSYFGIVDLCGIPKDRFYLYRSRWTDKETLHLLPHWTWPGREGQVVPVHCYTSWNTVELFVNGVSQGIRSKNPKNLLNRYRLAWSGVVYKPGEIKAVAYEKGKAVKEITVRTAGKPALIKLLPDIKQMKADGEEMAFILVSLEDGKNNLCPRADNLVRFRIQGPAEIAAVDNGNPVSTEPFRADYRKAFNGRCMVYLRSIKGKKGEVKVTAESQGLKTGKLTLAVK